MASISTNRNGLRRIQFINGNGERKAIHLGKLPLKLAKEIKTKVEALTAANAQAHSFDLETATWLGKIGDELHSKLAAVGLIPERVPPTVATLGGFVRDYIESRTDVKPRTRINLEQAERRLNEFFGEVRRMVDITQADADRWVIALRHRYAEATAARTIKRARQFFTAARRGKLIDANPFEDVKAGSMNNPDRLQFITRQEADKLIDAAPCADWRAPNRIGSIRWPTMPKRTAGPDVGGYRLGARAVPSPILETGTHHDEGEALGSIVPGTPPAP
jgi:hypothetical protein